MAQPEVLFRSQENREPNGDLLRITPVDAGWDLIEFAVRRLERGHRLEYSSPNRETCFVLLSGEIRCTWPGGTARLGPRKDVFESYPHALYLPPETPLELEVLSWCELAEGSAPCRTSHPIRVIRPEDCGYEIRGGGNATRQIVDIMPPDFPADRLLVCEVYTPSGNWSSYPPHKHDEDNPPLEVDLEEIYYYRFQNPEAYGIQRLYDSRGDYDLTLKVTDGDLVLIREGYHPFVAAYGYDAYYLNVLAGERRSMASADDPQYSHLRNWPPRDPRLPVVARPKANGSR